MKLVLIAVFSALISVNCKCQESSTQIQKILELEANEYFEDYNKLVVFEGVYKNQRKIFVSNLFSVNALITDTYSLMPEKLIEGMEMGFEVTKKHFFKGNGVLKKDTSILTAYENSQEFSRLVDHMIPKVKFCVQTGFSLDSLALHLYKEDLEKVPEIDFEITDIDLFIRLMWKRGIIILELHNRKCCIYSCERFLQLYAN